MSMERGSPEIGCAVFVLAGGRSTRMGTDKAFVELEGQTLLEHALHVARSVSNDVRIVGDARKYRGFAPVVEDVFPGCGPLGGIHAALRASVRELNVILAVDVPFVSCELLQYLIARASENHDCLITVPRTRDGRQPLCGVYRLAFADRAEAALRAGNYKIDAAFRGLNICAVEERHLNAAGFGPEVFRNLNTQEELSAAGGRISARVKR